MKLQDLDDFRRSLEAGPVQRAYRALMSFMLALRTDLGKTLPGIGVIKGYMDMTYFALVPPVLKRRGLKVPIVFKGCAR